jgi:hypothetical protein
MTGISLPPLTARASRACGFERLSPQERIKHLHTQKCIEHLHTEAHYNPYMLERPSPTHPPTHLKSVLNINTLTCVLRALQTLYTQEREKTWTH